MTERADVGLRSCELHRSWQPLLHPMRLRSHGVAASAEESECRNGQALHRRGVVFPSQNKLGDLAHIPRAGRGSSGGRAMRRASRPSWLPAAPDACCSGRCASGLPQS
ncbi:hypothetical protein XFF6990_390033 [Xanthomonas citri pv. fuscans]|nr:hypothetical protein XFF6990_390033 [Xanthomonas citri pv. fuscans]